ncbi:peptide deformylase, mitochondrial isoform X2 [Cryptotermes secundus]|uniref:peptide deformylase, mitochondrial isoform X2 n=1 Tax=Cryptotermes secundus TaxID=105785 RepID=UPI000CD7D445|nr:peptide deformylase, mitochondrial isoform X2 [Cryptotermes secundus]
MTILNVYRSKSALVYTLIFIKRHLITFRKFRQLYTEFWFPSPSRPPYNHICQIGDPVLRYKAEELNAEDIKKNEIQGVRKRISALTVSFGYRDVTEKIYEEFSPEIRKSREMAIIPFKVFINPELKITNYEKVCFPEACESVRGFSADVPRYREVLVTGLSAEGKPVSWQVSGWAARIVQHEMDHLSGRLYTDIMVRSTFTCTCWDKVNRTGGRIYVPFSPK